jgi:hypothetical protein
VTTRDILANDLALLSKKPYEFVLYAFPWGEPGSVLEKSTGPDKWQIDILKALGDGLITIEEAIKIAVASGHGIGKSALVSWIILWAISTKVDTRGVVTANTDTQLRTKTWPELTKWFNLFIAKDFFKLTATAIFSSDPDHEKTWRIDAIPWSKSNPEAFAGLHNAGKRILIIFDEASAIDDIIWEVMEGALSDEGTEIIWCAFGNPTRNVGRFRECFRRYRHRWINRQVDSSTVKQTNKAQIKKWVEDYGWDSDFVKVRVRGEFPSTSATQFISSALIDEARGKKINGLNFQFAPIIISLDSAWNGDEIVIFMRQGLFSKMLATYRGLQDDFKLAGYLAQFEDQFNADAVFIDFGYGTGVASAGKTMGRNWTLVPFGGGSSKPGFKNKRAEMYGDIKEWLKAGGCLPDDPVLAEELASPEYEILLSGEVLLESKKDMQARGVPSPNRADALALTFAFPVLKKIRGSNKREFTKNDYNPLG